MTSLNTRIPISTMKRRGGPGYCYTINWVDPSNTDEVKAAREERLDIQGENMTHQYDPWGIHKIPKSLNRKPQGKES